MRASFVNDSIHLRERAAEMRVSSRELKDNNTAAVIMRLADLMIGLPIVPRPEAIAQCTTISDNAARLQCSHRVAGTKK